MPTTSCATTPQHTTMNGRFDASTLPSKRGRQGWQGGGWRWRGGGAWDTNMSWASKVCFFSFFFTLLIILHRSASNAHHQLCDDTTTYHDEQSLWRVHITIKTRETRMARRRTAMTRGRGLRHKHVLSLKSMSFFILFFFFYSTNYSSQISFKHPPPVVLH